MTAQGVNVSVVSESAIGRVRTSATLETAASAVPSVVRWQRDYADLKRRLAEAGLFRRDPGFYVGQLAVGCSLFIASFAVAAAPLPMSWFPAAAILALAYAQLTFVGHDAGHNQAFATRRANEALALIAINLLVGGSRSWWVEKHNRHHGNPNTVDADPDIDFPVIAFSAAQARSKRGIARRVVAHQAYLFFPLLLFEAWHLRFQSLRHLLTNARAPVQYAIELTLIAANLIAYLFALRLLADAGTALGFVLVHHAVLGLYLGSTFATNHKGMPIVERGTGLDFMRLQILTSRNLRAHPVTDFIFGPLSCQIEHHLFPTMSRSRLRAAGRIVQQLAADRGIPYHETGVFEAYREVIAHLHHVSAAAREGRGA